MVNSKGIMSVDYYRTVNLYTVRVQHYFDYPRPLMDENGMPALISRNEVISVLLAMNELFYYAHPNISPDEAVRNSTSQYWRSTNAKS